jgi:hypothetical protein
MRKKNNNYKRKAISPEARPVSKVAQSKDHHKRNEGGIEAA